jgi:excisionase family DNA binding protein
MDASLSLVADTFQPRIGRSVSIDQASQLLGVSRRTIYNWIRAGRLQTIRTLGGGSQRVVLESLRGLLGVQLRPAGPSPQAVGQGA